MGSQSHQAGIETVHWCFCCSVALFSQSHQAGIETAERHPRAVLRQHSQSHQAGIETELILLLRHPKSSPNRTKLELKHNKKILQLQKRITPNRTKLELKPKRCKFSINTL